MIFFVKKSRQLGLYENIFCFFLDQRGPSIQSDLDKTPSIFDCCLELFLVVIFMVYDYSEPQKIKFNDGVRHSDARTPSGEALYPLSGHQLPSKSPKFTQ